MENKDSFEYTYSATEQEEIRQIREKYLPQPESRLSQLRRLDASVTRTACMAAVSVGLVGTLVLGAGMSMCLVWEETLFFPGIAVGLAGILGIVLAYPVHGYVERKARKRIAPEILRLTENLSHGD